MKFEPDVDNRIADLEQQLQSLQKKQAVYMQDRLFIGLTNEFDVQQCGADLLDHIRSSGISFCSDDFAVLSFRGTNTDPSTEVFVPIWKTIVSPIYLQLRNVILSVINLRHVGITCDGGGSILCLLNFSPATQDFYEEVSNLCQQINESAQKRYGCSFDVAVSELGQGISVLPELRKQIRVLDEYRTAMVGHVPPLLFYDQVINSSQGYPAFVRTINEQFNEYLDSGDFSNAKRFFRDTVVADFLSPPPPADVIRVRLSAIIDYLIQSLYRSCEALELTDVLQELGVPHTLLSCSSIDALVLEMEHIFDVLSSRWNFTGSSVHQLAQNARTYINENYADQNLNVNQLADILGVSPTHLTRTFQICYKCGVLEYLQRTRLNAAKCLAGSDMSIGQIAIQVGYGSSLNMCRAFKRYEGLTPSEYFKKTADSAK